MTRWQRRTRAFIAVFGIVFAAFVAREFIHALEENRQLKRIDVEVDPNLPRGMQTDAP